MCDSSHYDPWTTQEQQKPLPLNGLPYVSTFLGLDVLIFQLTMLMNVRWQLPIRNVPILKLFFNKMIYALLIYLKKFIFFHIMQYYGKKSCL